MRLAEIETALCRAHADRTDLSAAVAELDPSAAARDLEQALRARPDPTAPDTPLVSTLRRRYESVHALQDRLEQLDVMVERTLADLDAFAASVVELSFRTGGTNDRLRVQLDALHADAAALATAHDELASMRQGGP